MMLVFRDSPEHWIHLRGANLIESISVDGTVPAVLDRDARLPRITNRTIRRMTCRSTALDAGSGG